MSFAHRCDRAVRRGVTIIEVMFAVGVLLFGLVGIAALIPAAARMSRSSIDLDRGSAIGQAVAAQFVARGLADSENWLQVYDTSSSPSTGVPASSTVCVDPLFVTRPENMASAGTTVGLAEGAWEQFPSSGHNYFRRSVFPYYTNEYNPLIDPASTVGTANWPAMPRLDRVTVTSAMTSAAASNLVDDVDQLVFETPEDESLPPTQLYRPADAAGAGATSFPATRTDRAEYSWFATVQPTSAGFGRASVVVISGRDRTFTTPRSGSPLITLGSPTEQVEDPWDVAERVAYVSGWVSNFSGGAGGTVTLTATQAVKSDLQMGGWIMLIRNTPLGPMHAWYRMVHAEDEATLTTYTDPVGGDDHSVWQRSVTLEGPDWIFDGDGDVTTVADGTLAVLVDGVVSVHEFPVKLGP